MSSSPLSGEERRKLFVLYRAFLVQLYLLAVSYFLCVQLGIGYT